MIRVLRVLEYDYASYAQYEVDRERWAVQSELTGGTMLGGERYKVVSTVVRVQTIEPGEHGVDL